MDELRNTWMGRSYYRLVHRGLMPLAERVGLTANQATALGLAAAVLVPAGYLFHPLAGAGMILLSGFADTMDGMLARSRKQPSMYGAFLDSCLDRVSDGLYLMGIWILFWPDHHPLAGGLVMGMCLISTSLISYAKARAESLGAPLAGGLMERAARIVYLLAWTLAVAAIPGAEGTVLWAGALLYLALTGATAGRRMFLAKVLLDRGGNRPGADREGAAGVVSSTASGDA
ncbi:MAG: CDP-alcohol phosphatidyltransferase family protein [Desulfobulbaceae bacterium]|jgi:phosphatidylglycerophosphate synthase|nr:CDP-alcohol phosphatidyltransferase family protein [Desulfobulbaceae bacterium]MDY0351245.1 CDP-alcohol phosphatidyltransferase family protein [Desulfobulbaceae bacterium]